MSWVDEAIGWISEKLVYDEVGRELDRLAGVLRKGAPEERLSAVKQLTYMRPPDTVDLLIGALKDKDTRVRAAAAAGLGYKATSEAVTPLAVLLSDPEPRVRAAALGAINEIGLPTARSWIRAWREKMAASPSDDPRIADFLGRALGDTDSEVRRTALQVLPRHGKRGVGIVHEHLQAKDTPPEWRAAAEPELVRALKARDAEHRKAAVLTLFGIYGEQAVRPLAEALKDPSPEVRQAAVDAVTSLTPRPALGELLARLDDPDEGVVAKVIAGLVCARNLQTFDDGEEVRLHEQMLRLARYRQGHIQGTAAWALGEMGRVEAVGTLCDLLGSPLEDVVVAACDALGKINDPRAVGPLVSLLEREAPQRAAIAAIKSLTRADDVRVVPVFVKRLFVEMRPLVEKALEEGMSALCGPVEAAARIELHHADPAVRRAAVKRAINEPRLVFALISQVLDDPDAETRQAARDVLAKQGHDIVALARTTLRLSDKSESRRILAINLIVVTRPDDAVVLLDNLLKDPDEPPDVYRHAVSALKRLDLPAASAALTRHAQHAKPMVAQWAMKALGSAN
jgi:HEAT repeat protein